MRLSSKIKKGTRITLEADVKQQGAIYNLLDEITEVTPLNLYNVTHLELSARVLNDGAKKPKNAPIRITHPNSCSLKYDDLGLKLRAMLVESGIEPKMPPSNTES